MIGDPTPATREQGEGLLDSLAASWAQAIIEIHRMARVERREPTWANSTGTALCSPYHLLSLLNPGSPDEYQIDARFYPADRGRPRDLSLLLRGGEVYLSHQLVCPGRTRRVLPGQATGLYQHAGLDVEIKMGGPQINVMQLMAAGQADCTLGDNGQALETGRPGCTR